MNPTKSARDIFYYRISMLMDCWKNKLWENLPDGTIKLMSVDELDSLLYYMLNIQEWK